MGYLGRLRICAGIAGVSFAGLVATHITGRLAFEEYFSIGWHLGMLFVIALVDAPGWARAMGFGWIVVEFVLSGAAIQGLSPDIAMPIRSGGHLCTALWVAGAAWRKGAVLNIVGALLFIDYWINMMIAGQSIAPAHLDQVAVTFAWLIALFVSDDRSARAPMRRVQIA